MSVVSQPIAALTVAQFLEQYPNAETLLNMGSEALAVIPTLDTEPSNTEDSSDDEIEGEETVVKPKLA